jgi:flagellar protein FliS
LNPYQQYVEADLMTASPVELTAALYRCALESVGQARVFLADGDVAGRARPVSKAMDALNELLISLDLEKGGELSRNLAGLYGYMLQRLIAAHATQSDAIFAEVAKLLAPLAEAWQGVCKGQRNDLITLSEAVAAEEPAPMHSGPYGSPAEVYTGTYCTF